MAKKGQMPNGKNAVTFEPMKQFPNTLVFRISKTSATNLFCDWLRLSVFWLGRAVNTAEK